MNWKEHFNVVKKDLERKINYAFNYPNFICEIYLEDIKTFQYCFVMGD